MKKNPIIFLFPLLLLLILDGCGKEIDKPSTLRRKNITNDTDTFSLVFYNVENLFDYEIDGNEYPEYKPGFTNWDRRMYLCKLNNISSVLMEIDADIVALCEVEDIDALRDLQNTLKKKGFYYNWIAIGEKRASLKTVPALLSKFPVEKTASHWFTLPDSSFSRPILEVDINVKSNLLKLFVNHWPSRHQKESFRIAAAQKLKEVIQKLPSGTDYIITGDLNSNYDEFSTFKTFGLDDSKGITGINHILSTIYVDSSGFEIFYNETILSSLQDRFIHYNLWLELPENKRMSYFYKGNFNTLDHIILPPSLYDSKGISYVDNSFTVITLNGKLLTPRGEPKRWKFHSKRGKKYHLCEGYSDHLPVYAKFFVGPFSFENQQKVETKILESSKITSSWFEFHTEGWVADNKLVKLERSKIDPKSGNYSLHLSTSFPLSKNSTIAKTLLYLSEKEKKEGFWFYLKGEGEICLRIRNKNKKNWIYFNLEDNKTYRRAEYSEIKFSSWKKIVLPPSIIETGEVELQIRGKKGSRINLWIDK